MENGSDAPVFSISGGIGKEGPTPGSPTFTQGEVSDKTDSNGLPYDPYIYEAQSNDTPLEDDHPEVPLLGTGQNLGAEAKTFFNRFRGMIIMLFAAALNSLNPQILYYVQDVLHLNFKHSMYLAWSYGIYTVLNGIPLIFALYCDMEGNLRPLKNDKKKCFILAVRQSNLHHPSLLLSE